MLTVCLQILLQLIAITCTLSKIQPKLIVKQVTPSTKANPTGDPNFSVIRPFANRYLKDVFTNPFLMCDEWGEITKELGKPAIDPGPPKVTGKRHVGWHPHRGFDIVSVIKEGRGAHADSLGNVEIVRPGGIQWMRTGSGVEHAEGGGNPEGAAKHGFQLWINLPSKMKMNEPSYGTVQPENIPEVDHTSNNGGLVRYLAGAYHKSASFPDREDFTIIDVEIPPNATEIVSIPIIFERVIIYVYRGEGTISGRKVRPQRAAVLSIGAVEVDATMSVDDKYQPFEELDMFDDVATVELAAGKQGYAVMIFAAIPLKEPIAWRGPIVMNKDSEIQRAYRELQIGTFLKKRVNYNYQERALTK
jgi:quercetin 2,3-dioxygenase